ncbi:Sulfurtransferase [Sulfidibacter corallicola]|uniref:Sulfurtransferase n=1 Tax=Sulfidibacter corallicola TaxID=2818388 RepID=A0A8A4TX30_SULCO|nr:sulfurtransferase [Sulfidibacter corallicola]QTD54040.1 sulfurtransferase [Sulfidibacter corallicola]
MTHHVILTPEDVANDFHGDWMFIDCRFSLQHPKRGFHDYLAEHILGARYAHLDRDLSGRIVPGVTGRHPLPKVKDFVATCRAWGINRETRVVAYDDVGGAIAARLWWLMHWLGHETVSVLDGGWQRWLAEGRPISTGEEPKPPLGNFTGTPQSELIADVEDVRRAIESGDWRILDARGPARYAGEAEPIDPVAGHIPGAMNFPFATNLDECQCFLPADQLRLNLENTLNGTPSHQSICYCGSGVTAAHNLLAMAHTGLPLGKLYVGSWSEWITDPSRPVATGV